MYNLTLPLSCWNKNAVNNVYKHNFTVIITNSDALTDDLLWYLKSHYLLPTYFSRTNRANGLLCVPEQQILI